MDTSRYCNFSFHEWPGKFPRRPRTLQRSDADILVTGLNDIAPRLATCELFSGDESERRSEEVKANAPPAP